MIEGDNGQKIEVSWILCVVLLTILRFHFVHSTGLPFTTLRGPSSTILVCLSRISESHGVSSYRDFKRSFSYPLEFLENLKLLNNLFTIYVHVR